MRSAPLSSGRWKLLRDDRDPGEGHNIHGHPGRYLASEEPSPSQIYTHRARKHIAAPRRASPDITIEIRWRSAHKGVPGNEKADVWAKLAAEEQDARGWNG